MENWNERVGTENFWNPCIWRVFQKITKNVFYESTLHGFFFLWKQNKLFFPFHVSMNSLKCPCNGRLGPSKLRSNEHSRQFFARLSLKIIGLHMKMWRVQSADSPVSGQDISASSTLTFDSRARTPSPSPVSPYIFYLRGKSRYTMYFNVNQNLWGSTVGSLEKRCLAALLLYGIKF